MLFACEFAVMLLILSTGTLAVWPGGQYCLPMPTNERCPLGWERGYRSHTTEGNNTIQGDVPYVTMFGMNLKWGFCCKARVRYSRRSSSWPKGSYCVFRKGGFCPRGFREGSIYWDDKDNGNTNAVQGTLPDGVYDQNTQVYFCCRDHDGSRILNGFPQCNSLVLMRFNKCPVADGYLGPYEGYMEWNTEDWSNNDQAIQAYPDGFSRGKSGIRMQFCSYTSSYTC